MALTVTDFFARRASVFYWTEDGGPSVWEPIATEMAKLLEWSGEQESDQLAAYREWVAANRFVPVAA